MDAGMITLLTGRKRQIAEVALLVAVGLFMGAIGPYGTFQLPIGRRYLYWLICIIGGGMIGIAIDQVIGRRLDPPWWRLLATSILMTPAVTLLVELTGRLLINQPLTIDHYRHNLWHVFVIALPVTALRMLAWRAPPPPVIETRTIVEPPLPAAEVTFRRRLSARRRQARLIAIEAHDHYLRVHTDAGAELITLRFADALAELAGAHGYRVHRSWWVAGDALEAVQWRRGAGEARLAGDVVAPVCRTYAPALRAAGWF
jgi:hypothetical protein